MPIYEYTCRACEKDFEALAATSVRDSNTVPCPTCGTTKIARKISLMANPVIKSGKSQSSEPFSCGAPACCGGGCAIN